MSVAPVTVWCSGTMHAAAPQQAVVWAMTPPPAAVPTGGHFVVFREIGAAVQHRSGGRPLCLDCCHHMLDGMIMASRPVARPEQIPEAERMDGWTQG